MQLVEREGFWIREQFAEQDLVIVRDIFQNDAYRLGLIAEYIQRAKLVIDVGAHIGCFARLVHEMNPTAEIVCVEACMENLDALRANVNGFADIVWAACTYDPRPQTLWSAFHGDVCESTGGSKVRPLDRVRSESDRQRYAWNGVMLRTVTLEELAAMHGHCVDLLKLDCEGSEFSILANCDLASIGFVVGEYHGREKWDYLREWRMPDWDYGHMSASGDLGNFHLKNPTFRTHRIDAPHVGPPRPHI